ncbi:putative surface protein with fasciclin (FAS1) repeats [Xylophilus ampelinus]|uniref:Putative surface protein with fasciclin (FAS1) repeats n=2 Tax=Xylophilus ampelinus TaxID=54067 RepID=A0A318SH28_9BURK|nr:putative surface protein with fasciclin (FAS1) repeats [Xylophilus ampelinus]
MKKILVAAGVAALLTACAGGMSGSRMPGSDARTDVSTTNGGTGPMTPNGPAVNGMAPPPPPAPMAGAGMAAPGMAPVMVGGAPMYASRDIIDNAVNSKDHTTLVAAVKAAGLVDTLKGPGPFTVFAPTNAAFAALPAGTVDTLLQPANKPTLTKVLTYHVVPGRIDAAALAQQIAAGGGRATLRTVSGGTLTAMMRGPNVIITDSKGGMAMVTTANVYQSNGVIHVVDKVLLPS